jgi:uncharacterized membrane protein (UPF0127 family)
MRYNSTLHKIYCFIVILSLIRQYGYTKPSHKVITVGSYRLQVAVTPQSREIGLQGVKHIPTHTGMLFVYPVPTKAIYWMYRCYTAMDIVFLDTQGNVQGITPAMPPITKELSPDQCLRYTVNGFIKANQVKYTKLPKTAYVVELRLGEGINFAKTCACLIPQTIAKAKINAT